MKSPALLKTLTRNFSLIYLIILFAFFSCVKDDKNCLASRSNGGITVKIFPVFEGRPVVSTMTFRDTVYIKYGATSFPGINLSKYETKVVGHVGDDEVNITKLNCGAYYFFVTCKDTLSGHKLFGGASFITDKINGTFDVVVPVHVK